MWKNGSNHLERYDLNLFWFKVTRQPACCCVPHELEIAILKVRCGYSIYIGKTINMLLSRSSLTCSSFFSLGGLFHCNDFCFCRPKLKHNECNILGRYTRSEPNFSYCLICKKIPIERLKPNKSVGLVVTWNQATIYCKWSKFKMKLFPKTSSIL